MRRSFQARSHPVTCLFAPSAVASVASAAVVSGPVLWRQIFVRGQSTITLGVQPTDTVDGVKQMIEQREVS